MHYIACVPTSDLTVSSDTSHRHSFYHLVYIVHLFSYRILHLSRLSNRDLLADVEAERQEVSNRRENNNSVYTAEKSPDKGTANGGVEAKNASVVNSPDLSPMKNARNGDAEEAEIRKTKVCLTIKLAICASRFLIEARI